jgi:hypothetical protein
MYTNERKTNIHKQRRMKIRQGNILIDNTKLLREESVPRREEEEGPDLCIYTSRGGRG